MGVSASIAIQSARQRLETALFGLQDMTERSGKRFHSGLMNAVVFGRMVTFQLQNMRGTVDGWEEWYAAKQADMKSDVLMGYFLELRNRIEKTTAQPTAMVGVIHSFSTGDISIFEPSPPGATALVLGSAAHGGASGWLVPSDDGKEELYVVELPASMAQFNMHLEGVPDEFAGLPASELVSAYLKKLRVLVDEADAAFCP